MIPSARSASRAAVHHRPKRKVQHRFNSTSSASNFLRKQAEAEERAFASSTARRGHIPTEDKPWDGEERIRDAVLRMLVDSNKPLRVQGLKKTVQQPTERAVEPPMEFQAVQSTDGPPRDRDPYPWEVEYRAPKHHSGVAAVRTGLMVPKAGSRKVDLASRVAMAREAALDYSEGDREKAIQLQSYRRNDVSLAL
jgi:hypothetical protein